MDGIKNNNDKQKRNFALTKLKLQHMKHDPTVSIDDFISKMLVTPSSKSQTETNLYKCTTLQQNINQNQPSTNQSAFIFEVKEDLHEKIPQSLSNGISWDFFASAQPLDAATSHVFHGSIISNDQPNRTDEDGDFGGFTSFESAFQTAPLSTPPLVLETGEPPQYGGPIDVASSKLIIAKEPDLSFDDTFQEFQGCLCEPEVAEVPASASPLTVESTQPEKELVSEVENSFAEKTSPVTDWLRCLDECRRMLLQSSKVLSGLNTEDLVQEFLSTQRGNSFIFDCLQMCNKPVVCLSLELIEIYGVVQRIRLAGSIFNVGDVKLQSTFRDIDDIWSNLAQFIQSDAHKAALRRLLTLPSTDTSSYGNLFLSNLKDEPTCGVCMTPVIHLSTNQIALAGHIYHAACANLWVNRVQLSLPALVHP